MLIARRRSRRAHVVFASGKTSSEKFAGSVGWLRVHCNFDSEKAMFSYSSDGRTFRPIGGAIGDSQILQDCASDSSKYYHLTTAGAIIDTFNQIAQQITNVRVSK